MNPETEQTVPQLCPLLRRTAKLEYLKGSSRPQGQDVLGRAILLGVWCLHVGLDRIFFASRNTAPSTFFLKLKGIVG